jgi:hypothetical protein
MAYFCSSKYNRLIAVGYESSVFSKSIKTSSTVSLVHVNYVNIKLQGIRLNCTEWIICIRCVNITFEDHLRKPRCGHPCHVDSALSAPSFQTPLQSQTKFHTLTK